MSKLTCFTLCIILLLAMLLKLPLNRFIPEQSSDVLFSLVAPLTILSGNGYLQVRGAPDVWRFDYQMCSLLRWCVELNNGDSHLETEVSRHGSGVKFSQLSFNGNNQLLRDIISPDMASFDISVSADTVIIPNLACPANGVEVLNGNVTAFNINVLGNQISDIKATVLDNNQDQLTLLTSGSIEGELNIQPSSYTGRFKGVRLPSSLIVLLTSQQVASGWTVNGKLSCRSSS